MNTIVYMVRHGDSPKAGDERTRGLTEKGELDSRKIAELLKGEEIDAVISSPYVRSVLSVCELAKEIGQEVLLFEDLKERIFTAEGKRIADKELLPLLKKSFLEPDFSLTGGESNAQCQSRSTNVLKKILLDYKGKNVVIGTHGAVMTLMMGYFDKRYDLDFLLQTSKPDVYRMEFDEHELVDVKRLWGNH